MSYMKLNYIGGVVYWVFIKFCATELKNEQANKNIERNIFVLLVIILGTAFMATFILCFLFTYNASITLQ